MEPSEQTPLLSEARDDALPNQETPLPKFQIFLLTVTRVAEPLGFAILFPFVNSQVASTGEVSVEKVGYYVGLIESLFSLVETMFFIPWGWAADKYGRRPVLLISLLGISTSTILFGFSTRIWQMIAARCLGGLFGGSAAVVRTLFAEHSDSTNQARAFSWFAFASNIGLFIGPFIGGTFAEPAVQLPNTLGRIAFLQRYPYALPCLVAGALQLTSLALDALFLREPEKKRVEGAKADNAEKPGIRALLTPGVLKALMMFGMAMLLAWAYTPVVPLWMFTPVPLGGLAFPPLRISWFIMLGGITQSLWLLLAMPPLDKRLGTFKLTRICFAFWPFLYALPMLVSTLAKAGHWVAVNALVGFMFSAGSGIAIAFTSTQLMINSVAPPAHLGAVNGITLTVVSAVRAVAPAAFTALFAVGVEKNIIGRYLIWIVLTALAAMGYVLSAWAPQDKVRPPASPTGEPESDP